MTLLKDHPLRDLDKAHLLTKLDDIQTLLFNVRLNHMDEETKKEFLVLDNLYLEFLTIFKRGL